MALQRHIFNVLKKCSVQIIALHQSEIKGIKRWVAPTLKVLQDRKEQIKDPIPNPRSSYAEWNYDAEIYAFGKRLGEEFNQNVLRRALTHKSYIHLQEKKLDQEGSFEKVTLEENSSQIVRGEEIISTFITNSLETKFPSVVVQGIKNYLMSVDMLSLVGSHIGLKDLILTEEYPVDPKTIADTFKAVVAALEESSGTDRSELFIKEILMCQLSGKDLFDIWEPIEPYNYLKELNADKEIEPRLCNQSATNTILANFQVGIYSDKKLVGLGWGESIEAAKNTAALNALGRMYNIKYKSF